MTGFDGGTLITLTGAHTAPRLPFVDIAALAGRPLIAPTNPHRYSGFVPIIMADRRRSENALHN